MTQIFSAKLLRGLVVLHDPMKNKSKKNQTQHFAKRPSSPSSLWLYRSPVVHRLLSRPVITQLNTL